MSDSVSDLDSKLAALARELSAHDSAAFSLEAAKLAEARRTNDIHVGDIATYPERCRAQRHHDVLCIVLQELQRASFGAVERNGQAVDLEVLARQRVQHARFYADLAYPPPKEQP